MSTETTTLRSPNGYFWLLLATLGAGSAAIALVANTSLTTPTVAVIVAIALATVARSTYVIVTSAFSDAYRVFRSRHLLVCAMLLFAVAAADVGSMLWQDPFGRLFAHGRITSQAIAHVGAMAAALVCGVGSGVSITGAWDRLHEERHWYRSLRRQVST